MSAPHTVLALLERAPRHGYDLKRDHDRLFRDGRPMRFGQLYATLARLVRDGRAEPLGAEAGQGPDRKRYGITDSGRAELQRWLSTPEAPEATVHSALFTKILLALTSGRPARDLLAAQRELHLARMRELTKLRREGDLAQTLLCDQALFHLDADLRWMDLTASRLDQLAKEFAQ